MRSVNEVRLRGNLGNDLDLRYTGVGQSVTNFRMATNQRYTDKQGVQRERTEWHRITVWGKIAEACTEYLSKGSAVEVIGELRTRQWEDRDGNKRYTTEIQAKSVDFLGSKRKADVTVEGSQVQEELAPEDQELLSAGVSEDDTAF